jgi:membrane associated rhomboid family serine protease
MSPHQQGDSDWIEWVVGLANTLGLPTIKLRWRLMRWQKAWQDRRDRTRGQIEHAGYQHKVCPECGQVQDRRERRCVKCGAVLGARVWQVAHRLGLVVPSAVSVSTLLGMTIAVAYLRLLLARPGTGYFSVDSDELIYLGAYYLPALRAGELWRHATAIFLHIGLIHLGFNMLALAQIGPAVEDTFGRARMLFLFMFTGVIGFAVCQILQMHAISAGASGAIMGLCGAANATVPVSAGACATRCSSGRPTPCSSACSCAPTIWPTLPASSRADCSASSCPRAGCAEAKCAAATSPSVLRGWQRWLLPSCSCCDRPQAPRRGPGPTRPRCVPTKMRPQLLKGGRPSEGVFERLDSRWWHAALTSRLPVTPLEG